MSNANSVSILGVPYAIVFQTPDDNSKLQEAQGLCEIYARRIIVDPSGADDKLAFDNVHEYYRKVLRHEAFHAFFAEAGLMDYTVDETLVDFLAVQYPKIRAIMDALNEIEIPEVADV